MDHLFIAPTFMCATTITASLDDPQYQGGRKGLLLTDNSAIPEISDGLAGLPGFAAIADKFDSVTKLNDLIAPFHPRTFNPKGAAGRDFVARILDELGLSEPVSITAQSIHVPPTSVILAALPHAPVHVISDGLMSYGPTRIQLPASVTHRIERLVYLDLIDGVDPLLLSEYGVPRSPLAPERFERAVEEYAARATKEDLGDVLDQRPDAVILGQYLADLGLLTPHEEQDHHVRMLQAAAELGATSIVFKPHPSAPHGPRAAMVQFAAKNGIDLFTYAGPMPIEALLGHWSPKYVIGSFSTGLATARVLRGVKTVTVGCPEVAANLNSFQDSKRVPLAISYAMSPSFTVDDSGVGTVSEAPNVDVQEVIDRLASRMQPSKVSASRFGRGDADFLAQHPEFGSFFVGEEVVDRLAPRWPRGTLARFPRARSAVGSSARKFIKLGRRAKHVTLRTGRAFTTSLPD